MWGGSVFDLAIFFQKLDIKVNTQTQTQTHTHTRTLAHTHVELGVLKGMRACARATARRRADARVDGT